MDEHEKFKQVTDKIIELNPTIETINQILRTLEKHAAYKSNMVDAIDEMFRKLALKN